MAEKETRIKQIIIPAASFLLIIIAWEVADRIFGFQKILMPSPTEISNAMIARWDALILNTSITMLESISGFLLGSAVAYLLAISFVYSKTIRYAIYPYAIALKSTPIIAIAPLLILWFGNGMASKVVMSALVAFFPVLVNSVDGLTAIEREALDLMKSLSATEWQIFKKIRFPNSMPHLFSALKVASTLAVVGAVIAEFTGASEGIGFLINTSSYYLDTDVMFAGIVFISISGVLFFGLIAFLEKKIVFWNTR